MEKPRILRKRYIPDEVVDISGDELLYLDDKMMVTRWEVIHPREDLSGGISFSLLDQGYKISRFNQKNGEFAYWYCDVIDIQIDNQTNTYTFIDLLVDVKIMPDGKIMVLDLEEIAEALEKLVINQGQACDALKKVSKLLEIIYLGNFPPKEVIEIMEVIGGEILK